MNEKRSYDRGNSDRRSGRSGSSRAGSGRTGDGRSSDRPKRDGEKPRSGKPRSDRPRRDGEKPRSDRPRRDGEKPRSDKPRSDRPRRDGEKPRFDRPRRDDDKSRGEKPRSDRPRRDGEKPRSSRPPQREREIKAMRYPTVAEVQVPEEITGEELDRGIRRELESLSVENAKNVARHLVAVAELLDEDPDRAWAHAQVAVGRAGRIAAVREAAGFAAYACGKFKEALGEFRAARRISGDNSAWPVMADCERGLGNPTKAIAMAGAPEVSTLDKAGQVEMRIVAAGARRDLGQVEAAIVTLATDDLKNSKAAWAARLRYAYADALAAAGRTSEAREWFSKVVDVDSDEETDAQARLETLGK